MVTEGVSFAKLSSEILARDERILPYVDDAVKLYFSDIAEDAPTPDWHFSCDPEFARYAIAQIFARGAERRYLPAVEAVVDHVMNYIDVTRAGIPTWNVSILPFASGSLHLLGKSLQKRSSRRTPS